MIQEFSVENYLSFGDKQTVSFLATADKTLAEELTCEPKPGVKLLRMAMIYGANASGKSNLLNAIQSLWRMLFSPRENEHQRVQIYQPFELHKGEPTSYEIVFWANGRKFEYKLEHNASAILHEKMTYSSDKGVQSELFERFQNTPITFGSTLKMKSKQRDDMNRETLGNHTVLSTLNKKNIDVPPVMRELYEWIKTNVLELGSYRDGNKIAEQANENPKLKQLMLELLNKADFNISDFQLVDVSLPSEFVEEIKRYEDLSQSIREKLLLPKKQLIFTHEAGTDTFQIGEGLESAGTRVYFRLARLLFDLKNSGCVVMEDELEDSLHYDLLLHYLQTYLQNGSKSQLLFTTHNQLLLDENWMFRRDMVWFAEKDRTSAYTKLYRASDLGIHKNVSLLNAYRIGKLGAKPILGSTFLNTEEK